MLRRERLEALRAAGVLVAFLGTAWLFFAGGKTLSDGEIEKAWASTSGANPLARVWDYWKERARRQ